MTTRLYYGNPNNSRPADKLAGKGSVAGKLKDLRQKLESGQSTNPVVGEDQNNANDVVNRGYFLENDDAQQN